MEHAPLRPVPARPAGPIEPATALRGVSSWVPTLPPLAARALALVVLAEQRRADVASALGVTEEALGELLAEARKELRQTVAVLGGSGWCERAESLISDRLDGVLADRDVRRLDVHLRNCPRCVEHERRLVQATDALVTGVGGTAPPPATETETTPLAEAPPAPGEEAPQADDRVEEPALEEAALTEVAPEEAAAEEAAAEEAAAEEAAAEEAAAEEAASEESASEEPVVPPPAALVPAPPAEEHIAAAAEVLVAKRTRSQIAAAVFWNSLIALAVLLTLATIALTIAGIMGAEL